MRTAVEYIERIDQKLSPIKVARKKLPELWKEDSDIVILTLVKTKWQTRTFGGHLLNDPHDVDVFYSYILESDGVVKKYVDSFSDESQQHKRISVFDRACNYCGNRYHDIFAWGRLDDGWLWKDGDKMPIEFVCMCGNPERLNVMFGSIQGLYPYVSREDMTCKNCGAFSYGLLHSSPCGKCGTKSDRPWEKPMYNEIETHDSCPVCGSEGKMHYATPYHMTSGSPKSETYEYRVCLNDDSKWKKPRPMKCDRCDKTDDTWRTVEARDPHGGLRRRKLCEVCRGEVWNRVPERRIR